MPTRASASTRAGSLGAVAIITQKYGGTSVAGPEEIKRVARRIVKTAEAGNRVCAVVSAMGHTTDELISLASQVAERPNAREMDMLLTSGERISMARVSMAINALGHEAVSYTGSQAGILTDTTHGKAKIIEITGGRVHEALESGKIAIVAGFQGVSPTTRDVTTLGRGGSDTTAVAMAAAMKADICEIYTDVDGVYSADPRIVRNAKLLESITYEEMLEMAACGAKVLHLRAVEYARREGVPLRVRSSYNDKLGTTIVGSIEELSVEQAVLTGVAHDRSEAKITVVGVPDRPGFAARIFRAVADAEINIDMVLQNVSHLNTGKTDVTFTLPVKDGPKGVAALSAVQDEVGHEDVIYDEHIGKVTLVGAGMRSHPGVTATFCESLALAGVNIEMMNTSEIRISALLRDTQLDDPVRALHAAFDLGGDEEAVVYAGTGR